MSFTEEWFKDSINIVANGCVDCPLNISGTPRNRCWLTNSLIDTTDEYKNKELNTHGLPDCKLPFLYGKIRVDLHSYSSKLSKEQPK